MSCEEDGLNFYKIYFYLRRCSRMLIGYCCTGVIGYECSETPRRTRCKSGSCGIKSRAKLQHCHYSVK